MRSVEPIAQFQLQPFRQACIDGAELGEGAAALLGVEMAQVGKGQFKATAIQFRIHSGSSAPGSQRARGGTARVRGQISS
ncbi:MAG: hypothetical protein RLZZ423_690 [Cyanobacteriota bacterium]|jgi:hypothetical protein